MAAMEAQQWCEKPENHDEVARDHAPSASGSTARYEDITERVKGKFDYGIPGKVVEKHPQMMTLLERLRLLSVPEP